MYFNVVVDLPESKNMLADQWYEVTNFTFGLHILFLYLLDLGLNGGDLFINLLHSNSVRASFVIYNVFL